MDEFIVKINDKDFTFRVKKMNGIQALSFRSLFFNMKDNVEKSNLAYYTILENTQVLVGNSWCDVKQGNSFIPEGLENSATTILEIASKFLDYLKTFF